ncbi:MAG: sigma-54-dependent Fis family transcriptional regulator [Oligosphaeraceae bacterium]|nr:sigma-54-dependent Fis family transcriptional regulator [Oligosphaeraceae bacterium]
MQDLLRNRQFDLCFCEVRLWLASKADGDLLQLARQAVPPIPVIMLADYAESSLAEQAAANGAAACLYKPLKTDLMLQALESTLSLAAVAGAGAMEPEAPVVSPTPAQLHFGLIMGEHPGMHALYEQIEKVASTDMTVLIQGESGTGKELVAKAIHRSSPRAHAPFVAINCASMPENLLESELFGHVKGSFTGAVRNKDGLFLAANGGTLFLDEVGSISSGMQLTLLRTLQEREIRPVGCLHNIPVDVRVLAATNEDLDRKRQQGLMRDDLFYRLSVFPLQVMPLRERISDVELLANFFLADFAQGETAPQLSAGALSALQAYNWPGNVRELENSLRRAYAMSDKKMLRLADLSEPLRNFHPAGEPPASASATSPYPRDECDLTLKAYLKLCERHYLRLVLDKYAGDIKASARSLGISESTLYRKKEDE